MAVLLAVLSTTLCAPAPVIPEANTTNCLAAQMAPHHIDHANYPAVSGVSLLRRNELSILYLFTMELHQGVTLLRDKLV